MSDIKLERAYAAQREEWHVAESKLEVILLSVRDKTLFENFRKLIEVNLVRYRRLLVSLIICNAVESNNPRGIANLIKLIDPFIPSIGSLLGRETILCLIDGLNRIDEGVYCAMTSLLAHLIRVGVVSERNAFELIDFLMHTGGSGDITITSKLLEMVGDMLQAFDKEAEHRIVEELRSILQDPYVDGKSRQTLLHFFGHKTASNKEISQNSRPSHQENSHYLELDLNRALPDPNLGEFKPDKAYDATAREYEEIKTAMIEKYFKPKEEKPPVHDLTDAKSTAFKKKIYLILKGSLSGDEAAHKLLKLRLGDASKQDVAEIISKACSQEPTYSKFYGILVERLTNFHKSWADALCHSFISDYSNIKDYDAANIRNLGKFWGHALATECIPLHSFSIIHITESESSPASRVFVKFLFQELVAEIGIDSLKRKLESPELQPSLANIFPKEPQDDIMFSINYFTAIGLGALTDHMRKTLQECDEKQRARHFTAMRNSELEEKSNPRAPRMHPDRLRRNRSRSPIARRNRSRTPPRRR